MTELIFWFFLAVVQQHGVVGVNTSSQEECLEAYQQYLAQPQVLFMSKCQETTLSKVDKL